MDNMSKITEIMALARFPAEACECFEKAYAHIASDSSLFAKLCDLERTYLAGEATGDARTTLSKASDVHIHTIEMLLLLSSATTLRDIYREKGYSEELFLGVLTDLRCKLTECKNVHGLWGTFVFDWFYRFYDCTRFMIGRLQFDTITARYDYKDVFRAGDTIYNCHIPSSGPLTPESVEESFKLAYEFYGMNGVMPVACNSWLLYPKHYELVGANTRAFVDRFDVISTSEQKNNDDAWRVFGKAATDLESLPQNTSLQRNLYRYLKDGNKMGAATGIFIYDPCDANQGY